MPLVSLQDQSDNAAAGWVKGPVQIKAARWNITIRPDDCPLSMLPQILTEMILQRGMASTGEVKRMNFYRQFHRDDEQQSTISQHTAPTKSAPTSCKSAEITPTNGIKQVFFLCFILFFLSIPKVSWSFISLSYPNWWPFGGPKNFADQKTGLPIPRIHYSDFLAAMMASELEEHEACHGANRGGKKWMEVVLSKGMFCPRWCFIQGDVLSKRNVNKKCFFFKGFVLVFWLVLRDMCYS